jgi:DNA mismatch repair protein MutS2
MEDNYLEHEVDAVIENLKGFFSLQGMKNEFTKEKYLAKDKNELEISHQYLKEFSTFLHDGHEINIPNLIDLDPVFVSLEKQSVLSCVELYSIADLLSASEYIYDLLYDKKQYYHLNDDALDLNPVTQLKRDLITSIESDMTVSDNASAKLRDVRSALRSLRKQLSNIMNSYKNRYSAYLASDTIALKGDQEVLAVRTSDKGSVKGSVISYSSTGETVYMVPFEVFELRNKQSSLEQEEATEVMKVLSDLSQKAYKQLKYLKRDYEILMVFDRYLGSVRYGNSYNGCISKLSDDELSLNELFHPLLKAKKVVTNSITLGKNEPRVLLITGPNAGGKSIFIKATALSVMMDKLGLMTPCLISSKIPFIDNVFFLGGDNQSVMDNLSTFSSHLLGIRNITAQATEKSLVIIDEVGEGTSPKDGEALGVGLLKFFERKNCLTMLTSHFDGLKIYAAGDEKCLTGAMEFNTTGLKPTYRLLLHTTGKSYGILLARQMGLDESILKDAIDFQNERSNQDTDALMEKLTQQVMDNEKKARELDNQRKDLERLAEKKQKAIDALNEEKNSIKMKADQKINRLVDQRIEQINQIWKTEAQNKDAKMTYSDVSQAKGELKKIRDLTPSSLQNVGHVEILRDVQVGEVLLDEDLRRGKVIEIKKNEVVLDMDGLRIRRKLSGLTRPKKTASDVKVKKTPTAEIDRAILNVGPSQGLECNIIGLHVDEAMRNVVSFLDGARLRKFSYVRIVHGTGTFALKNAVWKYLQNHKEFVKDFSFGGEGEGGLGATVIHLK